MRCWKRRLAKYCHSGERSFQCWSNCEYPRRSGESATSRNCPAGRIIPPAPTRNRAATPARRVSASAGTSSQISTSRWSNDRALTSLSTAGIFLVHDHLAAKHLDIIVLFSPGKLRMGRLGLRPAVVGRFPGQPAFPRLRLEADLQRVVLVEVKVKFHLRRHLPQVDLDLLLQMRIAPQQRRQHLPRRGDLERDRSPA